MCSNRILPTRQASVLQDASRISRAGSNLRQLVECGSPLPLFYPEETEEPVLTFDTFS